MYTVYILYSKSINRYYVGYTNDLERRLPEHNRKNGKFTDRGVPWELVYKEEYQAKEKAMSREKEIKSKKSRNYIEELIRAGW